MRPDQLEPLTAESLATEVHDRSAEVGGERIRLPKVGEAAGRPNECFLRNILGHVVVAGQQPGQGGRSPDVLLV